MRLLTFSWQSQGALWDLVITERLQILGLEPRDAPRMHELMRKYRDLPMDLADAAFVALAERERISRVFTIDRRDFSVYRPSRIGRFTIIP